MLRQVRKNYSYFKFSGKLAAKVICFIVFLFLLYYGVNQFKSIHYFPITQVKVAGVQRSNTQEIQHLLMPLVKKSFFTVEVLTIKEQLMQLPWIADVIVRRVWPNQISIHVVERTPIARWNDSSLLSTNGELFQPEASSYPVKLPQFIGPEGEQIYMLQSYSKMNNLLAPLHFKIARLELTPTQSWSITFENGMKLNVGYKDILTRLDHFVKVYPKIVRDRASDVDYIDLRYSNGLAVRWKSIT